MHKELTDLLNNPLHIAQHQVCVTYFNREASEKFTVLLYISKSCLLCQEANKTLNRKLGQISKSCPLYKRESGCLCTKNATLLV